jgi:hypothetical protein
MLTHALEIEDREPPPTSHSCFRSVRKWRCLARCLFGSPCRNQCGGLYMPEGRGPCGLPVSQGSGRAVPLTIAARCQSPRATRRSVSIHAVATLSTKRLPRERSLNLRAGEALHVGQLEEMLHLRRELRVHLQLPPIRAGVIERADQQVDAGAIHELKPREVKANRPLLHTQLLQPVLKDGCRAQV